MATLEAAGQALAAGDLERAGHGFAAARRIDPGNAAALNGLGIVHSHLNRYDAAVVAFRMAVCIRPQWATAWANLGRALKLRGWDDGAEAAYRRAWRVQPSATGRCALARALLELHRPAKALGEAAAVIDATGREDAGPDSIARFEALQLQADAYADLHRPHDAVAAAREAVAMRPNQAPARRNLGVLLSELGDFQAARQAFASCLRLAPADAMSHYRLALVTRYRPDDPDALAHLQRMEALDRFGSPGHGDQAWLLNFALAKAHDDLAAPGRAFPFLEKANRLKRASLVYDVAADVAYMERIKRRFDAPAPARTAIADGPIFVVGMARSGTTLLETVLGRHSRVTPRGETPYFRKALNRRAARIGARGFFPEATAGFVDADWRAVADDYLAEAGLGTAGRIVDKLPHNFIYLPALRRAFPGATIVHALRDPMDTCFSIYQNSFGEGQLYAYDQVELGRYYRAYRAYMAHWQGERSCGVVEVRYEDLVADPERETRRLIEACGLPWEDGCLSPSDDARAIRTLSQHQARRGVYRSSVGRWRAYAAFLAPLMAELGGPPAGG